MKHHGDEQEEFDGEDDRIEIALGSAWLLVSQNQVGDAGYQQKRDAHPGNSFERNPAVIQGPYASVGLQIMGRGGEDDEKKCDSSHP